MKIISGKYTWQCQQNKFWRRSKTGTFKLIEGTYDPTTFLPLSTNIGGQVNFSKSKESNYLTEEQPRHVYKKVESGSIINRDTLWQEIEKEQEFNRIDDTNRDINPYKELIVNKGEKIEPILTQMEQWSILNNILNYIQYDNMTNIQRIITVWVLVQQINMEKLHL